MDLDAILPDVGEFGAYQQLLLWLVLLPAALPNAFHAYSQLFMAAAPDHWCRLPRLDDEASRRNLSAELVKRLSIPLEERGGRQRYSRCRMFSRNYSSLLESGARLEDTGSGETTACLHGWHFDYSEYANTAATEWELVCDKDFYPTLALVLFNVSGLIGNCVFGYLQDGLGRRPSFFIYLAIECFFGVATAFARDFATWLVFRVGVGFTVPAILASPYVLGELRHARRQRRAAADTSCGPNIAAANC